MEHDTSARNVVNRRAFLDRTAKTAAAVTLGAAAMGLPDLTSQADAATNITIWGFADNRVKWMKRLVPGFRKLYPQANVTLVTIPYADLWPKLQTVFNSNAGVPDMVDVAVGELGPFVGGDSVPFTPLDPYLGAKRGLLSEGGAYAPWTYKGALYGVGNEFNPVLMYYRWDMFKKAGITASSIKTWADYTEAGKQLKAKTGTSMVGLPMKDYAYWYFIARQRGGGFFDSAGNITVNDAIGVSSMQYLVDLVYKHKIAVLDPAGDEYSPPYYALMSNGAFATALSAPWYQGFMQDNAPKGKGLWEIALMPRWDQKSAKTVMFGGTGLTITKAARDKDLCWKFIEYCMLRPESQLAAFQLENLQPTMTSLYSNPALQQHSAYFHNQQPSKFLKELGTSANGYVVNLYESQMYDAMQRLGTVPIMQRKVTPKQGLDAVAAAVKKFING